MRQLRFALLGLMAAAVLACDSRDPIRPAAGSTRTVITDDPFPYDRVARVDVHVVSVSASVSPDTGAGAGGFVTLATPDRTIDLLALQGGVTDALGSADVPRGAITAVRLTIDTDRSSITLRDGRVLTGRSSPGIHWQSSAGRPTLHALLHENIAVPDAGTVVAIVFDVGKAFITPQEIDPASTDSGFVFSPVIRAADSARAGAITGAVRARTAAGAPVADASLRLYLGTPGSPENTWSVLATARTNAAGSFRFAFLAPSAYWSTLPNNAGRRYMVAVDPPRGSGLGRTTVPDVTVTAGTTSALGTIVLP